MRCAARLPDFRDGARRTPLATAGSQKERIYEASQRQRPREATGILMTAVAIIAVAAIAAGVSLYNKSADPIGPLPVNLPTTPQSYLGVYANGAPASYHAE